MAKKYSAIIQTEHGVMNGIRVEVHWDGKKPLTTEFGGIPLRTKLRVANITDKVLKPKFGRSELIQRLLAEKCELCGSQENIEVHHIRKLSDLKVAGRKEKPLSKKRMAAIRRKTLIVCKACHNAIHNGKPRVEWIKQLEE